MVFRTFSRISTSTPTCSTHASHVSAPPVCPSHEHFHVTPDASMGLSTPHCSRRNLCGLRECRKEETRPPTKWTAPVVSNVLWDSDCRSQKDEEGGHPHRRSIPISCPTPLRQQPKREPAPQRTGGALALTVRARSRHGQPGHCHGKARGVKQARDETH